MNKFLFALFSFLFFSCQNGKESFLITGTVPDGKYENEIVYLVPLEGATFENVDSTYIKDGRFSFSGTIDSSSIHIIRMKPILRLLVEELLVIVEPGTIQVRLDSISQAGGTVLNDALQEWKEKKQTYDLKKHNLIGLAKQSNNADLTGEILKIDSVFSEYNYSFVKTNKDNIVGAFVLKTTRSIFKPEQISELEEL